MTYVVTSACIDVKDRSCIAECPVDCIYEGGRMMYIHPNECIDCGACEAACPVSAIWFAEELRGPDTEYVQANASFFETIGSPRSAAKAGPFRHDAAIVEAGPPRAAG
jgi:NAD-dependent dihydropyrimidine dehydrogenase PreA subunit